MQKWLDDNEGQQVDEFLKTYFLARKEKLDPAVKASSDKPKSAQQVANEKLKRANETRAAAEKLWAPSSGKAARFVSTICQRPHAATLFKSFSRHQ